jgi:hypothetical protein
MVAAGSYWYFAPRTPSVRPVIDAISARPQEGVFGRFSAHALHLAVADLATETTRKTLVSKLQQDHAYQVDVAVQDNSQAVQRLATTLEENGIQVIMAAGIKDALKDRPINISYCLFADDIKPDELANVLRQLGVHSNHRQSSGVSHVIVDAMTAEHQKKLTDLFGPNAQNAMPKGQQARDPLGDLVTKRIIPGNPGGQGTSAIKPKVSPFPDRFALILPMPHGDLIGLGDSPELRAFLSRRSGQVPGKIRVFLVIREARA